MLPSERMMGANVVAVSGTCGTHPHEEIPDPASLCPLPDKTRVEVAGGTALPW